jgi:predicted Zn-dependent peptidase
MATTFQTRTLSNGLTIVCEADPDAQTSAAGFFVKTGARDEATIDMGVSHFLEHMMFKGTQEVGAEELNRRFDAMGARSNAYTSNELTCFYTQVLPEHLGDGLDLLCRMMRPALRDKDFDTEKGVILEEIAMYEDNPFWLVYESAIERHFGGHPLAHRVLGTKQSITDLRRDRMRDYFETRYSADNTVVALAGRVDFAQECARIESLCGAWTRTGAARDSRDPMLQGGEIDSRHEKVHRGYALALFRAPSWSDERRYASSLLAQILGAPDNSRLHWSLVEPGIAEEAQASYDPHDGFGDYMVFVSGEPDRLDEIWERAWNELRGLASSLTQDDIDRLLPKYVTGTTLGGERPGDRMHRLGRMFTYLGEHVPLEEDLARLSRVTLKELREACVAFPFEPVTLAKLRPAE